MQDTYNSEDRFDISLYLVCYLLVDFFKNGHLIEQLACGWNHTVFLLDSGTVYSCGLNDYGQTGHASEELIYKPGESFFLIFVNFARQI